MSTTEAIILSGILLTFGVSVAGLVVSAFAMRQAKTLELGKMADQLWSRQAEFVAEFMPVLRDVLQNVFRHGIVRHEETLESVDKARMILAAHAPFLPSDVENHLGHFLNKVFHMMAKGGNALPVGPQRTELVDEATNLLREFMKDSGFSAEWQRLRQLLNTDELTTARTKALRSDI